MIAKRIRVYGLVQGVGFRWFTCREANLLGITGWVRNRFDGSVEIQAQGSEEAVNTLASWARHGPSSARVTQTEVLDCTVEPLRGFIERETD